MSNIEVRKLFFTAWLISFLGALPIGTLNTSVANYTLKGDIFSAVKFGAGAIFVEVILVRIALALIDKLAPLKRLFQFLSIFLCLLIFYLAYESLIAAFHMKNFQDSLPVVSMKPFYSGLALSLLNPLHLPFWLAWTAVLKTRGILTYKTAALNVYIAAIGCGTFCAFIIYGFAGNYLMDLFKAQHNLINWTLGATLLLTGIIQSYKLIRAKFFQRRHYGINTSR